MSFKDQPYYHKFQSLIRELGEEIEHMKEEKRNLIEKNQLLLDKLVEYQNGNKGLFDHLSEPDKETMRQEISDLIRLVDKHISNHK